MKTFAINGKWVDSPDSFTESQAFQFGAGLFETIRVQEGLPLLWSEHMKRLQKSSVELGMDVGLDAALLEEWSLKLLNENPVKRCSMKLLWFSDPSEQSAFFYFKPLEYGADQHREGLKLGLSEIRRNPHSRITAHKTLNYLENILERRNMKVQGYDESVFLNTDGYIAEGTVSNIFVHLDGELITPTVKCGILPGIQRQAVLNACPEVGLTCVEKPVTLNMMVRARGIYLTNSLMGFMPVSNFMGNCYDKDDHIVSGINRAIGIQD